MIHIQFSSIAKSKAMPWAFLGGCIFSLMAFLLGAGFYCLLVFFIGFIIWGFLASHFKKRGGKADWMAKHYNFIQQAKNEEIDLLFIGDSLTERWQQEDVVDIWNLHFQPLRAANFGIGGDSTHEILWRLRNGELQVVRPRVVVLLAGTNNISMWETPKQIAKSIAKIVSEIRQRSPDTKILIQGIFPFGRLVNRQRNNVKRINELLAHLDDKKHVFFLDFGYKFLNKDGTISQEVMPDFLHLGRQGYLIWAAAIKPTVHNLLNYTNEVA